MMQMGRWVMLTVPALCVGLCAVLAAPPPPATPPWAEPLLKEVKLTPAAAQLEPKRWADGGPYRLDTFQRLWDDWRLIDPTARAAARDFLAADTFDALTAAGAGLIDVKPLPPPGKPEPTKEPPAAEALARSIAEIHTALGKPLTAEQKKDLDGRGKVVPAEVARAAAVLLEAVPGALKKRNESLAKVAAPDKLQTSFDCARSLAVNYKVDENTLKLIRNVDLAMLVQGGQELARAADRAAVLLAATKAGKFEFTWETPLGIVALNGSDDNTYGAGPYLLVLDTAGKDTYASGGATIDAAHPVSVLIDLAGDDTYDAKAGPAFGAGILGYGLLLDVAGNDTYRTDRLAFGTGSFGVGLLVDRAGKDRYEIDRSGQGVGFFGVGVLADLAGDDGYHCFYIAQGMGGCRGCGALVDREGNDLYEADDKTIRYASPQDEKHNTSLAQGCSFGRREHPGDGNSLAGGVGLLADGKGDDRYRCGVFGQGVSYWYGLGILVDAGGKDSYEGIWYVQGSAAHYGVGALYDLGGDDRYLTKLTMGQGAAHDYSTAWLHDVAGNDSYECPGAGVGFALYNAVGVFWDEAGDDTYKAGGASFGTTGETRPEHLCLALFIDEGGKNEFPKEGKAKAKSTWVQPANKDQPHSYGLGTAR